jgi:hypothetical protein
MAKGNGGRAKSEAGVRGKGLKPSRGQSAGGSPPYGRDERTRIESDIEQFYANVKEVRKTGENAHILELASQYCEDTKYFLGKGDYVTAFGCINYAHGLIDAFRKANEKD